MELGSWRPRSFAFHCRSLRMPVLQLRAPGRTELRAPRARRASTRALLDHLPVRSVKLILTRVLWVQRVWRASTCTLCNDFPA
eukprot:1252605-Rhodomonas_salina.1